MLLAALALTSAFAESCDDPYADVRSWSLSSGELVLDRGTLQFGGKVLGVRVPDAVAVRGTHVVFVENRDDSMLSDLWAFDSATDTLRRLVRAQTPNTPALSSDGRSVAFVDGVSGIASVYVVPFVGGTPEQLTNGNVVRIPGQAPEGFVPPPDHGLTFDAGRITWTADGATHHVVATGGAR